MRRQLLLSLICSALLLPLSARAQSGKIAGTVTDRDTGDPLPGATIVIDGTTRGSATDLNGEYVILNVDPGVYTLRASFVGYGTQVVREVTVSSDFTTLVDFQLSPGVELEEVVVQGQRLIQQDEVATTNVFRGEEIQELPVEGFSDVLALAAGVVDNGAGGQPNIRGGRSNEIAYIVDGVLVEDPFSGTGAGFDVARQSIDELQVMTGGFSAKYGEAMSGIVVVNTPAGSNDWHGSVRIGTDGYTLEGLGKGGPVASTGDRLDLTTGELRDLTYKRPFSNDWGTRRFEASLSGPILKDRITFFINADRRDTDTYQNQFQGPVRPAVFPWQDMVGYEFYRSVSNTFVDASGTPLEPDDLPEAVFDLEEGDVITQELVDALREAGVDVDRMSRVGVRNYQMTHFLGLYDDLTRVTANLGVKITPDLDARLGYKLTRNEYRGYDHSYKFLPQYNNTFEREIDVYSLQLTHRVTPTVFYELRGSLTDNRFYRFLYDEMKDPDNPQRFWRAFNRALTIGAFNTEGLSDADGGSNYDFYGYSNIELYLDYPFMLTADLDEPLMLSRTLDLDGDGTPDYLRGQRLTQEMIDQIKNLQNLTDEELAARGLNRGTIPVQAPPTDRQYVERKIKDYQFSFDLTAQLNPRNLLGFGLKYRRMDLFQYDVFPNTRWDGSTPLDDPNFRAWDPQDELYVEASPFELAAYVEDKIEFGNLVVRPGLRLDVLDPDIASVVGYSSGANVRRPATPDEAIPTEPAQTDWRLSPRLGIAFPITDRARLSFNYGQFLQYPEYNQMYQGYRTGTWVPGQGYQDLTSLGIPFGFDLGFETFIGNPNIDPQKTIFYQFDAEFLVSDNFKLGASLFYKDIYDYISYNRILGESGDYYWILDNLDYANARGFEVRAEKRLEQYVGFTVAYTFSRAVGNANDAAAAYDDWYSNSVLGVIPPKSSRPLDWDQPHTLNFTVNGRYQGFSANLIGRFGSGLPYTPTSSRGRPLGPPNSARQPWTGQLDARLIYTYELGRLTLRPFVEATNLLDRTNVISVFSTTGSPDFTLDPGTQFEDAQRINFYGPPRHFEMGVQLNF
ncbi:hypothetical protein AWN76_004565 [Rhodothermaceae bacterium RA]|nr:hypothetical protein AWN76_004565 [Rhodothermaceae bacterium RA]